VYDVHMAPISRVRSFRLTNPPFQMLRPRRWSLFNLLIKYILE